MSATHNSYADAKAAFVKQIKRVECGCCAEHYGELHPDKVIEPLLHLVVTPSVDDVKAAIGDHLLNFEAIPKHMLEDKELALYVAHQVISSKEHVEKVLPYLGYDEELFTKVISLHPEMITSIENASDTLKAHAEKVENDRQHTNSMCLAAINAGSSASKYIS